jgi:hypothetical protein
VRELALRKLKRLSQLKYPKASTLVLLNDYQVWALLALAGGLAEIYMSGM